MTELLNAIILGIVEGVTEFLPISSTGHLKLCERWLGISKSDPFWNAFSIFIQIGAILAVVVYFRQRIIELLRGGADELQAGAVNEGGDAVALKLAPTLTRSMHSIIVIAIATAPVLLAGLFLRGFVQRHLESAGMIAWALLVGGIVMILIERFQPKPTVSRIEDITYTQALAIGMAQILAVLFPGTSRSAATIMPGMLVGLSRNCSAEFSFFLAIPAMFAACGFSLAKLLIRGHGLDLRDSLLLAVGTLVSFLVAWAVIAGFMGFIRKHSFLPFAVYRIALGVIVLILAFKGII